MAARKPESPARRVRAARRGSFRSRAGSQLGADSDGAAGGNAPCARGEAYLRDHWSEEERGLRARAEAGRQDREAMNALTIIQPDDWHLHLRDGAELAGVLAHTVRTFARAIVMPNLATPVTTTALALASRERIRGALPRTSRFEPLMTLYLTDNTGAEEIVRARRSGFVFGVKYYPAGATTNSDAGVTRIERAYPALEAMQEHDLPLLVHGEVTVPGVDIFDRERVFLERCSPISCTAFRAFASWSSTRAPARPSSSCPRAGRASQRRSRRTICSTTAEPFSRVASDRITTVCRC